MSRLVRCAVCCSLIFVAFILCSHLNLFAQSPSEQSQTQRAKRKPTRDEILKMKFDDLSQMSLEELTELAQIVGVSSIDELFNLVMTTATKSEKKPDDVPSIVEVLTAKQIRQRGYRHIADLLNDLPNNHQDRTNWGIGEPVSQNVGFGFRFDTGQNILLLFNGQRLNAFLPGNRFGGEEYLMENVERVEIVRGPGSALYGANAFTAVVNIITKQQMETGESGYFKISPFTIAAPSASGIGYGANASFAAEIGSVFVTGGVQAFTDPGQNILVRNSLFGDAVLQDRIRHAYTGDFLVKAGDFRAFAKFSHQLRNAFTGFNGVSPSDDEVLGDKLSLLMYNYSLGADYRLNLAEGLELKLFAGWHQDNWTEVALIPLFKTNTDGNALLLDGNGLPILDTVEVQRGGRTVRTSFPIDGQGATRAHSKAKYNSRGIFRERIILLLA
jgi:hypothetical protein